MFELGMGNYGPIALAIVPMETVASIAKANAVAIAMTQFVGFVHVHGQVPYERVSQPQHFVPAFDDCSVHVREF